MTTTEIYMKKTYKKDLFRYYGEKKESLKQKLMRPPEIKYLVLLRKCQNAKGIIRKWYILRLLHLSRKTGIQISASTQIGEGFYIGHTGRIIINSDTVIGKNMNIATGVTIGQENRGERKGCPTIGNSVWVGTNAVVVGKITIGDDVLIAPNSYVNFDVPSHSIVVGNPARIIHRENATEAYVEKTV